MHNGKAMEYRMADQIGRPNGRPIALQHANGLTNGETIALQHVNGQPNGQPIICWLGENY
eukprot:13694048-Heterocapsa_arctica.AAC.1